MPSFAQFNPARIRSYIFRLPLCTRVLVAAILGLYIATIPLPWLREFARLEPAKMDFTQSMSFFLIAVRERARLLGGAWRIEDSRIEAPEDYGTFGRANKSSTPRDEDMNPEAL